MSHVGNAKLSTCRAYAHELRRLQRDHEPHTHGFACDCCARKYPPGGTMTRAVCPLCATSVCARCLAAAPQ